MKNDQQHKFKHFPWATMGRRELAFDFFGKCRQQSQYFHLLTERPLFSIVIPITARPDAKAFDKTISSLLLQSYPNWQAIIIGKKAHWRELKTLMPQDGRLLWKDSPKFNSLAQLKNFGANQVKGDWLGIVDIGDVLSPVTFYEIVDYLHSPKRVDLFYTNEVSIDPAYRKTSQFLTKPDMSWFDLIHLNYIGRFWMVKKELFEKLGGFSPEYLLAHEHDFFLRAVESSAKFVLLPSFFYYRVNPTKQSVSQETVDFVKKHLEQRNLSVKVIQNTLGKHVVTRVRPKIREPNRLLVSVIICFRDKADLTIECLQRLSRQKGQIPFEVILVNNDSKTEELKKVKAALSGLNLSARVIDYPHPYNYAHMHNFAIEKEARGSFLFLLNNDVFLENETTIDRLVAWAQYSWVGTVGMLLRHPDGRIQHGGFRGTFGGHNRLSIIGHVREDSLFSYLNREVFGNTFAACMIRKETYEELGGLKELKFANGYGDVVFNFECIRRGLKNLYLGELQAIHRESASRGVNYEYWEECAIERAYPDILQRMLRYDLGYGRIPAPSIPLKTYLRSQVGALLSHHFRLFSPFKRLLLRSGRLGALLTHH